jgi:hypothetical protein
MVQRPQRRNIDKTRRYRYSPYYNASSGEFVGDCEIMAGIADRQHEVLDCSLFPRSGRARLLNRFGRQIRTRPGVPGRVGNRQSASRQQIFFPPYSRLAASRLARGNKAPGRKTRLGWRDFSRHTLARLKLSRIRNTPTDAAWPPIAPAPKRCVRQSPKQDR